MDYTIHFHALSASAMLWYSLLDAVFLLYSCFNLVAFFLCYSYYYNKGTTILELLYNYNFTAFCIQNKSRDSISQARELSLQKEQCLENRSKLPVFVTQPQLITSLCDTWMHAVPYWSEDLCIQGKFYRTFSMIASDAVVNFSSMHFYRLNSPIILNIIARGSLDWSLSHDIRLV